MVSIKSVLLGFAILSIVGPAQAVTYDFGLATPGPIDADPNGGGPTHFNGLTIYSGFNLFEGQKSFLASDATGYGQTVLDASNAGDDNQGLVFVLPTAASTITFTYGSRDNPDATFSFSDQGNGPASGTNSGDGIALPGVGTGLFTYTYTGAPITTFAVINSNPTSLDIGSITATSSSVPEAATTAILGVGLLGISAVRRRRS